MNWGNKNLHIFQKMMDRPPTIDWVGAVGFFDEASQERDLKCEAGGF
jgi:hypothetical protein